MIWCDREPTLEDILSDPIVRVVMDADGVDPRRLELESTLREMALGRARRGEQTAGGRRVDRVGGN
jgi:hypothetical protein